MAKKAFTSNKYQAVIRVMNEAIMAGVSNDDLRQYVIKKFVPSANDRNKGTLDGVEMTMNGLSTYIANVKEANGLKKEEQQSTASTIIKRDTKVRSVCVVNEDMIVTQVAYITTDDLDNVVIPPNTRTVYGYQVCGAKLNCCIDIQVQLSKEQQLILKPAKSK